MFGTFSNHHFWPRKRGQPLTTWRIIPVSEWLVTPIYTPFKHLEGEQPHLGDLLTMVINHLLTGMIIQVWLLATYKSLDDPPSLVPYLFLPKAPFPRGKVHSHHVPWIFVTLCRSPGSIGWRERTVKFWGHPPKLQWKHCLIKTNADNSYPLNSSSWMWLGD